MFYEYRDYEVEFVHKDDNNNLPPNYKICNYFNRRKAWKHYKKFSPIFVKKVDKDLKIDSVDGKDTVLKGDYLCRGPMGELWPMKQKKLVRIVL